MPTFINTSPITTLYVAMGAPRQGTPDLPVPPLRNGEIQYFKRFAVPPGESVHMDASIGRPGVVYLYDTPEEPATGQPAFFRERLRSGDVIQVNTTTQRVNFVKMDITQEQLDRFKALMPSDAALQGLTLEQLIERSANKDYLGHEAAPSPDPRPARGIVTPCRHAVASVVADCILTVWGAWALYGKLSPAAVETIAEAIEPAVSRIESIAARLAKPDATDWERAGAIFDIGKLIYSGGMLEAIFGAIVSSLTWWDMVLYGVLGLAELTAAFLTEGAAVPAEVAMLVAQAGFLVSDAVKVAQECG